MPASIRGHQARFAVYQDGVNQSFDTITNLSLNQDSNMTKTFYVGAAIPEGDQSIEGWSGSFDMEIKNAKVDEFLDALINNNLAGIGVSQYFFIASELYPDGTVSTYLYSDCQFSLNKTVGGLNSKVTKSVNFQAMSRVKL